MDANLIKTAPSLKLKPNPYLRDHTIPWLYQRRASLLMLIRPRMVLGDDVGLGKTLEAIITYAYLKAARPETKALVLTEKVAFRQWVKEFEWLTPKITTKLITSETHPDPVSRVKAMRQNDVDVVVTSYSMVYNYAKHLLEGLQPRWVLFADEPNYFKNTESQLHSKTNLMVNGPGGAVRAYGLTATIVENRLEEAFAILRVICPGTLPSWYEFEKEYCKVRRVRRRKVISGYKNLDKFRKKIEPVFYGRLQDDPEVKQELPEVLTKDVEIVLTEKQSEKLLEAMDRIIQMPGGETKQVQMLPALIYAQLIANDPRLMDFNIPGEKTAALIETLEHSLAGERVIIYSKFRKSIDLQDSYS